MEPLLVIDDIVVMDRGLVLLPAIPRAGLPLVAGDTIDLCSEEGREQAQVLAIDPDPRHADRVRLRIAPTVHAARGVEVWPGEGTSGIVTKRPPSGELRVSSEPLRAATGAP